MFKLEYMWKPGNQKWATASGSIRGGEMVTYGGPILGAEGFKQERGREGLGELWVMEESLTKMKGEKALWKPTP